MKQNLSSKPNLSFCLIAKNEEQWLPKCFASIKPIADEIIFVDTGSTDNSVKIAESYGAKVFHKQWEDDFSLARNFSLQQASGNWIFIIDADETLSSQDCQILKDLTGMPATEPTAYQIITRNYINRNDIIGWQPNDGEYPNEEQGCGWMPSLKTRLWSNHSDIRFSYPVHELVTPALEKLKIRPQPCAAVVHHYGKLNQLQADAKGGKYFQLGLRKLGEIKNEVTPLRELAIQAGMLKRHTEAIDLWQKLLKLDPNNAEAYLNLGSALFAMGKLKEALQKAETSSQLNPDFKESYFNRSLYELHLGRPAAAEKRLRKLLQSVPKYNSAIFLHAAALCCKNGIKAGRKAFAKITNDNITEEMINIAGCELAETLLKAGRNRDAEKIKKATSK